MESIISVITNIIGFMVGFSLAFRYNNRSKLKKNKHRECSECRWNVMNGGTCYEVKEPCYQFIKANK